MPRVYRTPDHRGHRTRNGRRAGHAWRPRQQIDPACAVRLLLLSLVDDVGRGVRARLRRMDGRRHRRHRLLRRARRRGGRTGRRARHRQRPGRRTDRSGDGSPGHRCGHFTVYARTCAAPRRRSGCGVDPSARRHGRARTRRAGGLSSARSVRYCTSPPGRRAADSSSGSLPRCVLVDASPGTPSRSTTTSLPESTASVSWKACSPTPITSRSATTGLTLSWTRGRRARCGGRRRTSGSASSMSPASSSRPCTEASSGPRSTTPAASTLRHPSPGSVITDSRPRVRRSRLERVDVVK